MRAFSLLVALPILVGVAGAQYHTADYFSVTWAGVALKSTQTGGMTSMALGTASHYQCEVDLNNKLVLVLDSTSQSIWQVDPFVMAVTGTLASNPVWTTTAYGLEFDQNGDLWIGESGRITKLSPGGAVTTVTASLGVSHMTFDIDTSNLLFARSGAVQSMDRNGANVTTLGTGFSTRYGDMVKDPMTGDVFVPTCCGWLSPGQSLQVLKAGTSVASIYLASNDLAGAYGPNLDRVSAANPRLVTGSHVYAASYPNSGGMWWIDLATAKISRINKFQLKTISDSTILECRNVQTVRSAAGKFDVRLNVPTDGGDNYVLALSMTGYRPMFPLPDGRRVPLVVDHLTVASLQGWLAPYVTGTVGKLDAFGLATAKIDVSSLIQVIKGLRIWMVLATLDPKAPLGISIVCDPKLLVLE